MSKYKQLAADIIEKVGGEDNIAEMSHCMTRLRLSLKDDQLVNKEALEQLPEVMRVVLLGGQYQIVLGGIVDEVFEEASGLVSEKVNVSTAMIQENLDAEVRKGNVLERLISLLSGIVTPIIPAMLAAGFITAVAKLAVLAGIPEDNSTIQLLSVAGDVLYGFFPIIIGWSAAKYFKANIAVTLMVVGLLVYPHFTALFNGGAIDFLGVPVTNVYYGSSILPAICSAFLLAKLEWILRRILPNALRSIFVPFLSALITIPLLITVIGPIGVWGGELFANLFRSAYAFSPILAGAIIGGSEERVLDFLEKVADGTPTMLRMVSYTLSGQPVVHDITFESRHFLYRRDDTRSGGSITQQRYSYLVADGSYIYLSDYADLSYRENPDRTLEAQILAVFTASSFSDWDSFRGVVEDMTASRLESDATMARYWSEDGTHWVNLTADPMDYTVTSEKYGMSRTLTQFDGLVDGGVEILSAQWLSDTQVQLNCRIEGQEGLYYAVFDLGAEQVISVGK